MYTYLLRVPVTLSDVLSVLQPLQDLLHGGLLLPQLLHLQRLSSSLGLLLQVLERLLDELDILNAQLLADDVQVPHGVNVTLDVDDLSVIEAPDDLEDGVDGADVGQEGITQTGTGRGTAGQAGNVVHGQVGGYLRFGLVVLAEPVVSCIRDDDTSFLWFDGGIGEVGRVTERALGDGLEERRLADVCKTDLGEKSQ